MVGAGPAGSEKCRTPRLPKSETPRSRLPNSEIAKPPGSLELPRLFFAIALLTGCAAASARLPDQPPARTVRLSRGFALAAISIETEITEYQDGRVSGRFWATSGNVNRSTLRERYGCTPTRDPADSETWVCTPKALPVDWRAVLAALDRSGVMAPAADDTPRSIVCNDGTPWSLVVHDYLRRDSVVTARGCRPVNPERVAFERRIDSIASSIDERAQRRR